MGSDTNIYPSFSEFHKLAARGNLIPIYREIIADMDTPVSAFQKLAASEESSFLLESVEHGEKVGRYSFIGSRPSKIFQAKEGQDLTVELEKYMKNYRMVKLRGLPSFCGGLVGYLSYENVSFFERIKLHHKTGPAIPSGIFFLVDRMLIFDQMERTLKMVSICHTDGGLRRSYNQGIRDIEQMTSALTKPMISQRDVVHYTPKKQYDHRLKSNMEKPVFENRVRKIKEYIRKGDCIQTVFSQRFDLGMVENDFEVYRALRVINPSPYMFFFKHRDLSLIGSSPEVLVEKEGKEAEIKPIAGTRRRGRDEEEDRLLERELKTSPKELAEHLMLVDLGRNDLGRICKYETVRVKEYARIEKYSHVMHLVSDVVGELRNGENAFSLLRAAFPAGTVTGAPKIRAMEIIDELEEDARGPYAGCLGYFSFSGDMDMCIMIRTIVVKGKKACVQAGAGIVFDSKPSHEYQETVNKAKALFDAVELARGKS